MNARLAGFVGLTIAVAALPGSPALSAQQDASADAPSAIPAPPLQGLVEDETTAVPIPDATVTILGSRFEVTTGASGEFVFPAEVPSGLLSIRASAPGYVSTIQQVEVDEQSSVFVQLLLPSITATLDELLVQGRAQPTASDSPRTAADLLATQISSAQRTGGEVGATDYAIRLRGQTSFRQSTDPIVVVDGVRVGNPGEAMDILSTIPAADVASMRILRGPSAGLLYASFAANGVIVIETRTGRESVDR